MLGEVVATRATVRDEGSMTTTPSQPAIRATGLRKSFADQVVLDGIDLQVAEGTIFALLGPNGAGKTTTVDNLLTGQENLLLMADLHHLDRAEGRRRAAELLERFDLAEAASKPAATYSGGMRRRLDLAMGLVGDPRIVFLDEPTTGLDPRSRRTMWQSIR